MVKHNIGLKPKCEVCGNRGKVTKEGLCALCYKDRFGVWSRDFMADSDKRGK